MAILLPFVFVLEPQQALALIIGAVAVVHTSDTIASVLVGIPGSASATVLLLDGHEMAKQGHAARALSIAFVSSMFGGLLGAIGLTLSIPIARPLVLSFGSPELFMLTVLGISLTALLSRGNMLKGLVAGAFGLLLGQIGAAPATAEYRYTFGSLFLTEGLDLVAVALGIFGLAEVVSLVARKTSVAAGCGPGQRLGCRGSRRPRTTGSTCSAARSWASGPASCPASVRPRAPGWRTDRRGRPRVGSRRRTSARVTPAASSPRRVPTTRSRPVT